MGASLRDERVNAGQLARDRIASFLAACARVALDLLPAGPLGLFDRLVGAAGIRVVRSPVQAPNAHAFAEAWVASLKRECLNYFGCFSLRHLEHIVHRYVDYYNKHRPHQRLSNRVLRFPHEPQPQSCSRSYHRPLGRIGCQSELGGLLKHYCRRAA